jgi:hypothetical protein
MTTKNNESLVPSSFVMPAQAGIRVFLFAP